MRTLPAAGEGDAASEVGDSISVSGKRAFTISGIREREEDGEAV